MDIETLREDYIALKQTYDACEKEYIRLTNQYNAVVLQNQKLQEKLLLIERENAAI